MKNIYFYNWYKKKDKNSGFLFAIEYITSIRACVLLGIYHRPYWNINKKCLNIGYLFIGYKNIISLIKG